MKLHEQANYFLSDIIIEAALTVDVVKQKPKFKNVPSELFDKMDEEGLNTIGQGGYIEWVLNRYMKSGPDSQSRYVEDMYKIADNLKIFDAKKNKGFWKEPKDINQYATMLQLFDATRKYKDEKSQNDYKVSSKDVDDEDIETIYDDESWSVKLPKTTEASIILGRGTSWCTAAQGSRNMFDHYNGQGPLYVLTNKTTNDKYQLHQAAGQFMDKDDTPVSDDIKLNDGVLKFCISNGMYLIFSGMEPTRRVSYLNELPEEELNLINILGHKIMGRDEHGLLVTEFEDSYDLAEVLVIRGGNRNDNTSKYVEMLDDLSELFMDDGAECTARDMFGAMSKDNQQKVRDRAKEFDMPPEHWLNELQDDRDELWDELERAYGDATRFGAETECYNAVVSGIGETNVYGFKVVIDRSTDNPYKLYNDGRSAGTPEPDIHSEFDYLVFTVDVPYYGFFGFDEDAFNSEVRDML